MYKNEYKTALQKYIQNKHEYPADNNNIRKGTLYGKDTNTVILSKPVTLVQTTIHVM